MNVFQSRYLGDYLLLLGRDLDTCVERSERTEVGQHLHDLTEDDLIKKATRHLRTASELCAKAGLKSAEEQLGYSLMHLKWQTNKPDYSAMCAELRHGINSILQDLNQRLFLEVKGELRHFVDNDVLFGSKVKEKFPGAVPDIRESGNCLASDCSTAAVFHLMRVAEYGLRALAYDRRIKLDKNQPLDLATWEALLGKLEDAENAIRNFKKTSAREAQFDFFHGAMMELRAFKNKFRNRVMHTRESYDALEAMSAFQHVKGFMEILSICISEKTRTPRVWKNKEEKMWMSRKP